MGTIHEEMVDREIRLNGGLDPENSDDAHLILLMFREELEEKGYLDSSFDVDTLLAALSWMDTWRDTWRYENAE